MKASIKVSTAHGKINVMSSKSYAHRLLIASALTNGESKVSNIDMNNDILATINCIKTIGKKVEVCENTIMVENDNHQNEEELIFDCLESGSTLRFFIPIALATGRKSTFKGSKKLLSRGLDPYFNICDKQNIKFDKGEDYVTFEGKLKSGDFLVPGDISSQFITGLLFALAILDGDSTVTLTSPLQSKNYVDITIDVLHLAGIEVILKEDVYYVKGNQKYNLTDSVVEGDYSNAAFFDALNYLNGNVELIGLNPNSLQGDKVYKEHFKSLSQGFKVIDLKDCIDLGPILFCFAGVKFGAKFINTNRLKIKESNRVNDLKNELNKIGIEVVDTDNQVIVNPASSLNKGVSLEGCNDHRIVMALSVLLSLCGGTISGIEAVNKSYPKFFKDLQSLGIEVEYND